MAKRQETMASVAKYLATAGSPLPKAHDVYQWAGTIALLGSGLVVGFYQPWVWVGLLAAVAILAVFAGVRLQIEADRRARPAYRIQSSYESRPGIPAHGQTFAPAAWLWGVVHNDGPAAEFVARIRNVKGVTFSGSYQVDEVAWENSADTRYRIERNGSARLKIGGVGVRDRPAGARTAIWFYTARSESWSGDRHAVGPALDRVDTVTFDLEVDNVTYDVPALRRARVTFDDSGQVADFVLLDAQ